jgi:hypothetical protein
MNNESDPRTTLRRLEEEGWEALATSAETTSAFYGRVLDDEVEMLLPGGLRLRGKDAVLASMSDPQWRSYELRDLVVRFLGDDVGLVTYIAEAVGREGATYEALMTSLYLQRHGRWRLALHQHTPR